MAPHTTRFGHKHPLLKYPLYVLLLVIIFTSSCATRPPAHPNDSCAIFNDKSNWYKSARRSYKKWGVPIPVQLAIIYQESRFVHDAKPPRKKLLWIIPWKRLSSAYGYGQAQDATWDRYKKETGNRWADRDDFADVTDFIGWYGNQSYKKSGIAKDDAYNQYLAYHEGQGGFNRKTHRRKGWLLKVATKVQRRSKAYRRQLAGCESQLDKGWWIFR